MRHQECRRRHHRRLKSAAGSPPQDIDPLFGEEVGKFSTALRLFSGGAPRISGALPYAEVGRTRHAKTFNRITKYVATRKGVDLTWKGSVALRDAAKDVAKLKQEEGPALVTQGSTELVHALLAAGLVDEIRTFMFPLVLGKGKRLFGGDSQPRAFKLTHSAVSPNGLIAATYMRDGEVKTATVGGADKPSAAELARREKLKREG